MRKIIDIFENSAPPKYEEEDADNYEALRQTGFFGRTAAGCVLIAKTTGRLMLVLRSAQVEQPFTWGNCGGACKPGVTPYQTAQDELHEETGYTGSYQMIPLYVFQKGEFKYHNYLAIVEDEFIPELGWEADDHKWCTLNDLPNPLHFGIQSLFSDEDSIKTIKHYIDLFS